MMHNDLRMLIAGTDLLDLVRRSGVKMTRWGGQYCGDCPFCGETAPQGKMPPFAVYEDDRQWRFECCECTESGNALEYIRRLYNLKLCDAVKYLQGGVRAALSGVFDGGVFEGGAFQDDFGRRRMHGGES